MMCNNEGRTLRPLCAHDIKKAEISIAVLNICLSKAHLILFYLWKSIFERGTFIKKHPRLGRCVWFQTQPM